MKYLINNLRMSIDDEIEDLKRASAKKLGISIDDIKTFKITKQSIDARRKPNISFVNSVLVETDKSIKKGLNSEVRIIEEEHEEPLVPGTKNMSGRPVVVGFGPAGMFAGLVLAQNGYKPLIIERGKPVEERSRIVETYWKEGILDTETNVQFGEGGAGTFSDGKLTTRINDKRCTKVLNEFVIAGANADILYRAKPHIGSDVLKTVVKNMRKRILDLGGEIRFGTKLASIKLKDGNVCGLVTADGETIETGVVVLAIGHSARDTFESLFESGIQFIQKPFSIGVRIEHPQEVINFAQYGTKILHPKLGAADYQLFVKQGERTVYTFCMCPRGVVVAAASEPDSIVVNGMSEFARDKENANSAMVVSVEPEDFGSRHPLAGIEFQRKWERLAFIAGGRKNSAPVQRLGDFLENKRSVMIGSVKPSYTGSYELSDINGCLPQFVTDSMKKAINFFDSKVRGFGMKDAILTGVETRTSSPVRIPRGETLEAIGITGLYPAGEGAGYAGGIVSAAVDGIRIAEQIIKTYKPVW